jgi:hypothetical protein
MDRHCSWRNHLDTEARQFRCLHCQAPVTKETVRAGRWVAQAPENAAVAGYHITGIMPAMSTAEALCKNLDEAKFVELFVQGHVGLPETSGQSQITPDMVVAGDWPNTLKHPGPTFAGLDQGRKLDFVCGDGQGRIVAVHRFDDWSQVASAMETLHVRGLVGDSQPEPRPLQELVARFPGRVRLADYSLLTLDSAAWFERDRKAPRVRIHRTAGLDFTAERIIMGPDGGDLWPALPPQEEAVLKAHLCASKRALEEDTHGVVRGVWKETGDDHLRHAHLYYTVAASTPGATALFGWGK